MTDAHIKKVTAQDFLPATGNLNCYEYYRTCTDKFGEYYAFQHMGLNHYRSELIADIDALSAYFSDLGLKRGDAYSVFMPNNVEGIITFYALNKLGVIVNFIHPMLPPAMLLEIMQFTKSKGIMLLESFAERFADVIKSHNVPAVICCVSAYAVHQGKCDVRVSAETEALLNAKLDNWISYPEILKQYSGKNVDGLHNNGEDTAVYLNGGGTTGKSKTIMLTNKSLNEIVNKLGASIERLETPGEFAKIVSLPFFHAYGLGAGGLSTLCNGSTLIPMMRFDAEKFVELMQKNKVYEIIGVPNMFRKLLVTPGFLGNHLKDLKYMYAGGDEVTAEFTKTFDAAMESYGSIARLCPGYGLTEACAVCCTSKNWDRKLGTIGKAIVGNRVEIWDDNQKVVPFGTEGEIAITGSTVMKGYLNAEGTENDGVYIDENGERWILTGDIGYMDEEGFVYFRGRKKRLIIISGYNVFPTDIENTVLMLPSIKEACAVQGYQNGKPIVRLFVVLKNEDADQEACKRQIIQLCSKELTTFSVPRDIQFIDAVPRTRMEKVDFMALTETREQAEQKAFA